MISRAARRTRSERKSLSSPWPLINAVKRSRVRSDAGILSIGVLLRQRPVAKPTSSIRQIRRRCTPTLFPAILGLHLSYGTLMLEIAITLIVGFAGAAQN